ncbi:MAG: hypothetical protein NT145_07995 [Elusimicrobia bacterium]|nr:hypothetical protein [Elusimicrobiota bacterium]
MVNPKMILKKILVLGIIFWAAYPLYAGLTITPSRAEVSLKNGESANATYNVRNDYVTPVDIEITTKDWFILPENKDKGINVTKWLSVSSKTFHLNPGENRDLNYKVEVSSSAQGSMVGMISFLTSSGVNQGISLVISVPVFVTVLGTEKKDWDIENLKISLNGRKLQVSCDVKNTGNIHLRPAGFIEVMSGKRKVLNFNFMESRPIYPGSSRTVLANSSSEIGAGNYGFIVHMSCAGQEKIVEKNVKIKKTGEITVK